MVLSFLYFKIPTFIATLGTLNVFHGILLTVVGTKAVNSAQLPDCFKKFGATNVSSLWLSLREGVLAYQYLP